MISNVILHKNKKSTLRLQIALILICLSFGIGTIGFMMIENYSFSSAFYMTIITLSTVGFTEVHELSAAGRWFTSLLILFNLGVFAYSVTILSTFILEGEFRKLFKDMSEHKKIDALKNHVIVCGCGSHGREIAMRLTESKDDFVIIDSDNEVLLNLESKTNSIHGDATIEEILIKAGVQRAESVITALPEDADNLFVVLTARELNPNVKIISRCKAKQTEHKLMRAGANHVILPEKIGSNYMVSLATNPNVMEFIQVLTEQSNQSINFLEEVSCSSFHNKSMSDLDIRKKTGVNVIGLKLGNGEFILNPDSNTTLNKEMRLITLGNKEQIAQLRILMTEENFS